MVPCLSGLSFQIDGLLEGGSWVYFDSVESEKKVLKTEKMIKSSGKKD